MHRISTRHSRCFRCGSFFARTAVCCKFGKRCPRSYCSAKTYPYYSSFSDALLRHSSDNVDELVARFDIGPDDLVVEVASNDGYLLKNYAAKGIPVLGIDPAAGPAAKAEEIGIKTLVEFFDGDLAAKLANNGQSASIIHANNVLAHVADTNGFVAAMARLLNDDGVIVIEVPYVKNLIDQVEFDTIYHEHLCYFSVLALDKLFRRHGLYLNNVRQLPIHGGSLRLFVQKREQTGQSVIDMLADERDAGLDKLDYFSDFADRVVELKQKLLALLSQLQESGKTIAAYGAAAKGSTLINYVGIDAGTVDFVVDRNTHKHGLYMPGKHLPVLPTEALLERMPDYALILAWNFAEEIRAQQADYVSRGGKFIVPVPEPVIL